jgi:hypothetical protein
LTDADRLVQGSPSAIHKQSHYRAIRDPIGVAFHRRRLLASLDDSYDRLHLFPNRRAQLVTGLLHLGPELLADLRDLRLLNVGQVQVPEASRMISVSTCGMEVRLFSI